MPFRSTSSTEPDPPLTGDAPASQAEAGRPVPGRPLARPVLGRPSAAAEAEPALNSGGDAAGAAWRVDWGSAGWCTLRVASVAGVRHRLAGEGSDDSYAWVHDEYALAVAVADGVGSVPGSAATAARACVTAVRDALACREGSPLQAVRAALEGANGVSEGGGATTLVVALLLREGGGAIARVGDSSAWTIDAQGVAVELFVPPDPERADTTTAALPVVDLDPEVRSLTSDETKLLVLVTDGIADPWRDGPTTVAPAFSAALSTPPDPLQLLSLVDFSRQGCHDDRTLLGVWVGDYQASDSASTLAP